MITLTETQKKELDHEATEIAEMTENLISGSLNNIEQVDDESEEEMVAMHEYLCHAVAKKIEDQGGH